MIKKIFFQSIFLSFLFFMEAFASESGGMPQLNPEFWISQIFWLTITFGILYVVLSKLILPKISANLEIRKSQILENIEAAEKQREASELKIEEYEKIVQNSKNEAKKYFIQAREKILKDINVKKNTLDKELGTEIQKAETEIQKLRDIAPEKINKIAVETSTNLLQQLIGAEVNSSSISAIVDDLSRKKMDKYYGN
jgi:F-type H+-transporting ATPase subunit b